MWPSLGPAVAPPAGQSPSSYRPRVYLGGGRPCQCTRPSKSGPLPSLVLEGSLPPAQTARLPSPRPRPKPPPARSRAWQVATAGRQLSQVGPRYPHRPAPRPPGSPARPSPARPSTPEPTCSAPPEEASRPVWNLREREGTCNPTFAWACYHLPYGPLTPLPPPTPGRSPPTFRPAKWQSLGAWGSDGRE